ncbi:peptidylprolyl isomerase [Actinomarinicola tropica]|uniref:Peptidyl-prolyl cis-trans isomerase n=1 Tax=Actinomarinicola tropica TaxID=2789776 RepID=A0A5Q2RI66_9ACTN|nr:peptidylprolyl isomerase [Actinomarinicola tropica]QGG96558.1 hypothetical protein GH723_16430 [Actinomarinicola tropica]
MPSDKRQRQKERERAAREAQAAAEHRAKQRRTWIQLGGLVVLIVVLAALYSIFAGGDDDDGDGADTATDTSAETSDEDAATDPDAEPLPCPPAEGVDEPVLDFPAPPPDCLEEGASYEAVFDTTAGEIRVALDVEETPNTANNFAYLARYGYYDGTDLFRSNTGIEILQGGSPHTNSSSDPGPGYNLEDEGDFRVDEVTGELSGPYTYEPGQLVMARTPLPDGAGAQFFFTTGPAASQLDGTGTYVVFGNVTEGMDVLEAIMATHEDGDQPGEGAPNPVPVVNSVQIVQT